MNLQKRNLYLIIAIIVGVVAIGATGFASWKYFGGGSELEKNGNEIIKPLLEKETEKDETIFEITNWKTYNNAKANFTFQYPKDWKVISEYFYETASGVKSKKLTVTLGKNEKEEISINLRQAQCNAPCKCKEIGENIIQTCSQNSEVLKTFNQIVSTFKIVEVDETANWESYKNKEYGYEIKYPNDWKLEEGIWDCVNKYNCIGLNPPDKKFEYNDCYYGGNIEIFVYQNPNNLDLESAYSQSYTSSKIGEIHFINPFKHAKEIESITVGKLTGTKFTEFKDFEAAANFTMVSFPYQKIIIEIKDTYNLHQQDAIFSKILSTFKFIE